MATKENMTCEKCIYFESLPIAACYKQPRPMAFAVYGFDPKKHYCGQGCWKIWSERYQEFEPYYWGEWEQEPPCKPEDT